MSDQFGDRMKRYENGEVGRRFTPLLPVIVRLDGKCFSKWTSQLEKPYDNRMIDLMTQVTKILVEESNARIGYTQSDEISLVLYSEDYTKPIYFDGKIHKIVSVLTSVATYWFNEFSLNLMPAEVSVDPGFFDCRAWTVPNQMEAVNSLLWRECDATRNSINSAARMYYTHDELHGVSRDNVMDMLWEKGVNWNDYPSSFKRGVYVQKRPDLKNVNKKITQVLELPPLSRIVNRVEVLFEGQDPHVQ